MIFVNNPDEWIDISESFEDDQGSSVGIYAITNGKFVYFSYNASADGASTDVSGFTVLDDKYIPSRPYCGAGADNNGLPLVGYFDYNNLGTIMTSSTESLPCFLLTIFYPINL